MLGCWGCASAIFEYSILHTCTINKNFNSTLIRAREWPVGWLTKLCFAGCLVGRLSVGLGDCLPCYLVVECFIYFCATTTAESTMVNAHIVLCLQLYIKFTFKGKSGRKAKGT